MKTAEMNSLNTDLHPLRKAEKECRLQPCSSAARQEGVSRGGGGVGSSTELGGGKAAFVVLSISARREANGAKIFFPNVFVFGLYLLVNSFANTGYNH